MTRDYSRWTHAEDEQLLFLRERVKLPFPQIDALLKRKTDAARGRYRALRPPAHRVKLSAAELRTKNIVQQQCARDNLAAAQAARQQSVPRSLTSAFFGDPPPGHSALDLKMGTYIR